MQRYELFFFFLQKLTSLDVSFCPKVTDVSMRTIYSYVVKREKREVDHMVFFNVFCFTAYEVFC